MSKKQKIDPEKETMINDLEKCLLEKLLPEQKEKLSKLSSEELRLLVIRASFAQLTGQTTISVEL